MRFLRVIFFVLFVYAMVVTPVAQAVNTITVTATIPPNATTVNASLTISSPEEPLPQDTEFTVTLSYEASYAGSYPFTLQGSWGLGTIDLLATPTVSSVEFVPGSAGLGYGNVVPVVDALQRTITWEMPSFPSSAGTQTVSFRLKTTHSYTGNQTVTFPVGAASISPVTTPVDTKTITYQYLTPPATPTPTPTAIPVATATATPDSSTATNTASTPTPIPTVVAESQTLQKIELQNIQATSAQFAVFFSGASTLKILYGTSATDLNASLTYTEPKATHFPVLTRLESQTRYYLQLIELTTGKPQSEVFTFITASSDPTFGASASPMEVIISRNGTVVAQNIISTDRSFVQSLSVPEKSILDIHLALPDAQTVKALTTEVRAKGVLGIMTDALAADEVVSSLSEMEQLNDTIFAAKVKMPADIGDYELVSHIQYQNGILIEYVLSTIQVVDSFTVYDSRTRQPLENASVYVKRFNAFTQLYESLPASYGFSHNPSYTQTNGKIDITLLPGKYTAQVQYFSYASQEVEFAVLTNGKLSLPDVYLDPQRNVYVTFFMHFVPLVSRISHEAWHFTVQLSYSTQMAHFLLMFMSFMCFSAIVYVLLMCQYPQIHLSELLYMHRKKMTRKFASIVIFLFLKCVFLLAEVTLAISCLYAYLFFTYLSSAYGITLALLCAVTIILLLTADFISLYVQKKRN